MSYADLFNNAIDTLITRGLDKSASEIISVKEAMFSGLPIEDVPYRHAPLHGEKNVINKGLSDPTAPFAKKGDPVVQLDPFTGKETLIFWNGNKHVSQKDIERQIDQGVMTEERLNEFYERGTPQVKTLIKPLIVRARNKPQTFNSGLSEKEHNIIRGKLSHIIDSLDKLGYTILVKKLSTAVEDFNKAAGDVKEEHTIPSVEEIYENSSSPKDFGKEVKKLISVHDKIIDLVKKFDKQKDKIDSSKLPESEAVKKTVKIVRDVGKATDSELKKIS